MTTSVDHAPEDIAIRMYRGDDFSMILTADEETDLTGATVLAQVRLTPDSDEVIATFAYAISGQDIVLSLATEDVALVPDRCRWDVQVTFGDGAVETLAYGPIAVVADVSRP